MFNQIYIYTKQSIVYITEYVVTSKLRHQIFLQKNPCKFGPDRFIRVITRLAKNLPKPHTQFHTQTQNLQTRIYTLIV